MYNSNMYYYEYICILILIHTFLIFFKVNLFFLVILVLWKKVAATLKIIMKCFCRIVHLTSLNKFRKILQTEKDHKHQIKDMIAILKSIFLHSLYLKEYNVAQWLFVPIIPHYLDCSCIFFGFFSVLSIFSMPFLFPWKILLLSLFFYIWVNETRTTNAEGQNETPPMQKDKRGC